MICYYMISYNNDLNILKKAKQFNDDVKIESNVNEFRFRIKTTYRNTVTKMSFLAPLQRGELYIKNVRFFQIFTKLEPVRVS